MNDTVVAIVSAFFIIGIAVGIIAVVACRSSGPNGAATRAITPTLLTTILTGRASRRRYPDGTTPCATATHAGRLTRTAISAAGKAALGEGKLPCVPGRGGGARQHPKVWVGARRSAPDDAGRGFVSWRF